MNFCSSILFLYTFDSIKNELELATKITRNKLFFRSVSVI
ncbi:hypothetical protein IMCC3317_22310 [Kordia antarctica]|uniref:Uncharacterized protein n=1 Tax=Kordia antarctica TaxID=1218801 RepID=A0A7L4ZK22_9FLAO|nr:hypothetical protein IMCC3317_22310 [Kordia antarctica]